MKRKALITSTAILLVAVMCLATASYAWFTAGQTAKINGFNLSITQSDSAIQLAPVSKDGTQVGAYKNSLTKASWGSGWAVMSDVFVPVSSADGENFFPVGEYQNDTWTSVDAAAEGYLYFKFNVKAPAAGTATLTFTAGGEKGADTFQSAAKLAVAVGDEAMNIYDLDVDANDSYQPMTAKGAVCEKNAQGNFVPVAQTGFAAARTQTAVPSVTVDFDAAGVQTVTVAYWVEGMDTDCQGNWKLDGQTLDLDFTWAAA